ncbi:MAG: M24 family metallopeptidase [Actinomycetota bacterium]
MGDAMDYEGRLDKLRAEIGELDAEALLITNLTNVRYLTGFSGSNAQLLVTPGAARFLTDGRYRARAKELVRGADVSIYLNRMTDELVPMLGDAAVTNLAVEGKTMTLAQRDDLAKRLDVVELVSAGGVVEKLRRIKEPAEIDKLRTAIAVGDSAYAYILDRLAPGRTEREIALDLEVFMRTNGADEISFEPIVGSGPLSAHIHHTPSERALEKGDFVLLDFGARIDGYCGDLTRTAVLGAAAEEQSRQYDAVLKANASALSEMTPGASCKAIDAVARTAVKEAGYDDFGHGLGHGVGLEVHEDPRFSRISEDTLAAGMVMTNEPGLYLETPGGVRIEDCVLITDDGAEVLTGAPKDTLMEL